MRPAEHILRMLERVGKERNAARELADKYDRELATLLEEAQAHPEVTMSEAATVAGIGRSLAYKLMRKSGQPDSITKHD